MTTKKRRPNINRVDLTWEQKAEREFGYMTPERSINRIPEHDYSYNIFLGEPGDDEDFRSRVAELWPEYILKGTYLTFGKPSLGTIMTHLKRFDHPDWSILDVAADAVGKVMVDLGVRESCGRGQRKRFARAIVLGLSEDSLPSHPGIFYRSQGYKDKRSTETIAMLDAQKAIVEIEMGQEVLSRPVALFGRGKRLWGDDAAGVVGCARGGRLVMCTDARDHLIIAPFAAVVLDWVKKNWKQTEMMLGMSFQNRGSTIFCYNLIQDLYKTGKRISWHTHPEFGFGRYADKVLSAWSKEKERDFRYFVLDIRRQDSSTTSALIDKFFEWARGCFDPLGVKVKKRFGRWARWIREYMVHTRIALPDGKIWIKHLGNVSGSPLTTVLNTYTALFIVKTVFHFLVADPTSCVFRVYGDNVLVVCPWNQCKGLTLESLVEATQLIFGIELNPTESYEALTLFHQHGEEARRSVSFLGRHFLQGGGVWRPTEDTLGSMVAPESSDRTTEGRLSRCIGLLMDNPFNIESVSILNKVMDDLEDEMDVHEGLMGAREARDLKYKLQDGEIGQYTTRLSTTSCQDLYEWTPDERREYGLRASRERWDLDAWAQRMFSRRLKMYRELTDEWRKTLS